MSEYADELELDVTAIAQGGDGVGRWQGRVIFATGALPGERVRVRLHERKPRYARGTVTAVLSPCPERIAPRLPGADHMPWQHISYAAQLRFKQTILQEQLAKLAGIADAPVAAVLPAAHPWGYRNTAHLRVAAATGQVGYYAADSHTIQDMLYDPLLLPVLNETLAGLRSLLPSPDWQAQEVTLRASAAYGYAVALVQGTGQLASLTHRWQAQVPALAGVATSATATVRLHEQLHDVIFTLSPSSFFQTHTAQAAVLVDVVQRLLALQPHERLLDAYSGVGTFALPLASQVQQVLAIESHLPSVADGEQSARLNGLSNVTFVAASVERGLARLNTPIAAAILDPPRRGCHPAVLRALVQLAPARIAYVSCQPGILARDLQPLLAHGYRLHAVQPVDMFPQTPHIECVALVERE